MFERLPKLSFQILVQAVGVPVGQSLGGRVTTISGHYKHNSYLFKFSFSPLQPFLIEGVLQSKNLYSDS